MKVIDIECRGNLIKFYFGADECTDYHGDDWNDPFENDTVYSKYVATTAVYAVPWTHKVWEAYNANYSYFVKENFKDGKDTFVLIADENYYLSFQDGTNDPNCVRLKFEMSETDVALAMNSINAVLMSGSIGPAYPKTCQK